MKLTLTRNPLRLGCTDEWTARLDGAGVPPDARPGIGRTRAEAKGALLGANLGLFGIVEQVDVDPLSETVECRWVAQSEGGPQP